MGDKPLEQYREVVAALTAPGAAFAILDQDVPSIRRFAGTAENLNIFFAEACRKFGGQDLLEYEGARHTLAEVRAASDRLAAQLRDGHGIEPGDRVGIAMRNCTEWFIAFFAVLRVGAIATLLNSRGAAEEIASAVDQVTCGLVLADEARAEMLQGQVQCPVIDTVQLVALVEDGGALPADLPEPDADDPALIIFTSGTTGTPKGATLTHRNLCAAAREIDLRTETGLRLAARSAGMDVDALRAMSGAPPPTLLITPMFHISGIVPLLAALTQGACLIVMHKWDPVKALDLIEANKVASLAGPSMIFEDILALPDAARRMASLRNCAIAGQATPARLAQRIQSGNSGTGVSSNWGQTETTGAATAGNAEIFAAYAGTVGEASRLVDIAVVDKHGDLLPPGEVGELMVRGSLVMKGYWDDEGANAKAFCEGWLRSGDLGRIEENGLIYIADRIKDMVISKGANIYCAEVERVLSMLPQQQEVALFGVPDDRLGERAIAAVVLREDAAGSLDEAAVCAHVREHLADYKVPTEVRFDLGPLPRNVTGKIDKVKLSQFYLELAQV